VVSRFIHFNSTNLFEKELNPKRARLSDLFGRNLNIEMSRVETRDTWSFRHVPPINRLSHFNIQSAAEAGKPLIG
jgi:hypothetical protein